MKSRIDFNDFEEARQLSGLFFERMLTELEISERTYYRWKKSGSVPRWAMRIVELLSGDLSHLGWRHWQIRRGVLITEQLNSTYYYWTPGQLLSERLYGGTPYPAGGVRPPDPPTAQDAPIKTGLNTGEGLRLVMTR